MTSPNLPMSVRELRGVHRTQAQFATEVGVTRETVAYWETGKKTPDLSNMQRLVALGLSPKFLMGTVGGSAPRRTPKNGDAAA